MKTVTCIDDLISSLNDLEKENGKWLIYPKIAGYNTSAKFDGNTIVIDGKIADLTEYLKERDLTSIYGTYDILIAPDTSSKWIDVNNLSILGMLVKSKIATNVSEVLNRSYIFSIEENVYLPSLPHRKIFKTLYELLDNLNAIDRDLRITDWLNIGLIIERGKKKILYIKPPLEAITRVKEISYNVGRTGAIIPIARFEPVNFNGLLTIQATLHNSKILFDNKLQPNDIVTIKIKRQGHQSTEVSSIIYPYNKRNRIPTLSKCPSCNSTLVKKKGSDFLMCYNNYCQGKLIRKILHWCSNDAMGIKGLGVKYVEYLVKNKILTTVDDIYILTRDDLVTVPGILSKMAGNIIKEIDRSKRNSLIDVFIGLGIEHIGNSASKLLGWHLMCIHNLLDINDKNVSKLSSILGKEQRKSLLEYLKDELNREMLFNLSRHLDPVLPEIRTKNHRYYKKKVSMRGTFIGYSRVRIKNLLMRAGAYVAETESKEFDYCLYDNDRKLIYDVDKKKVVKISRLLTDLIC